MTTQVRDYVAEALVVLRQGREELAAELARLDVAIDELAGKEDGVNVEPVKRRGRPPGRKPAVVQPAQKPAEPSPPTKKKRQMSDAARERIRAGARARWARHHAQKNGGAAAADGGGSDDRSETASAKEGSGGDNQVTFRKGGRGGRW